MAYKWKSLCQEEEFMPRSKNSQSPWLEGGSKGEEWYKVILEKWVGSLGSKMYLQSNGRLLHSFDQGSDIFQFTL